MGNEIDIELYTPFIERLGKVGNIEFVNEKLAKCVTDVSDSLESMIATDDIDMSEIIVKLERQKEKLEKEIAKLNGMLNNERFVANAPKEVIDENRSMLGDASIKLEKVLSELALLA
jgi:valyl-tRNA synthetase